MTHSTLVLPVAVPLSRAPAIYGISRSTLYRLAAAGRVRMFKLGSRTLVDGRSVHDLLVSLPELELRQDLRRNLRNTATQK